MTDDILLRDDHAGIATLTLNAPGSFNALSTAMIAALAAQIAAIATDQTIRVVVLKGAGKAFCAGHDLREMQSARAAADQGRAAFATLFADCAAMMQALTALPQPVIAQVHGVATAAGCQLVASCDLAVAATGTRFGVNGINIGLFCATPMVALTRKVAPAVAFEMLSTGEFISADRAREVGLINRVAAPDDLDAATQSLAQTLADKLPQALQMGKTAFAAQSGLPTQDAYAITGATMVENMLLTMTRDSIDAFLSKRR